MVPLRVFALLSVTAAVASCTSAPHPAGPPRPTPASIEHAVATITPAEFQMKLAALAHDSTRGRETPSPELAKATDWVAARFRDAGLRPAGDSGFAPTFLQHFPIELSGADSTTTMTARWSGASATWTLGRDLALVPGERPTAIHDAPVVFLAGVPADTVRPLGTLSLRGAVLLQLVRADQTDGRFLNPVSNHARSLGALAHVVVVEFPPERWPRVVSRSFAATWILPGVPPRGLRGDSPYPLFALRPEAATALLAAAGESTVAPPPGTASRIRALDGMTISLMPHYAAGRMDTVANVVGILPGSDPALRDQAVIFTSHMDHVGVIGGRCRPAPALPADSICNGADDNASGTVGIIELAEAFAALDVRPARSLVFAAFTAEERGLFGSRWYVDHPVIPLERTVAVINLDMIARDSSGAIGTVGKDYSTLGAVVDSVARAYPRLGVPVDREQYYPQSDHYPFAQRGVPALFFNSTAPADLHTAADNPDRANNEQAARTLRLVFRTALAVANAPGVPVWDPAARARIVRSTLPSPIALKP